jgi:cytochrome P450
MREDALSLLVRATYDDGSPLEDEVVRDELLTLLMAGYETTTAGLTWSFEQLLRAPDKLERLLAELEAGERTYLDAVVKETLRRRPVIPLAARKAHAPIEVLGYTLPAGSVLMVSIYLIHLDPDLHPDPLEFRPERFLGGGDEIRSWLPFGGGVRRCLGASLAQYEMAIVLRTVLEEASLRAVSAAPESVARRRFTFSPGDEGRAFVESVSPGVSAPSGSQRFRPMPATPARVPELID